MDCATREMLLSKKTWAMVLPGLEFLAAQLKMAESGLFPHRHPFARIAPQRSNVYGKQAYYADMAEVVLAARNKVRDVKSSGKLQLHVFEFSALALGLRVALRGELIPARSIDADALADLQKRLEKFRRRARNTCYKKLGIEVAKGHAERWRNFVQWLRYNVCYFQLPRWQPNVTPLSYTEQAKALRELMDKAWTDRGFARLSPEQLKRFSKLAIAKLRRHFPEGLSVLGVLENTDRGSEFLFNFVFERMRNDFQIADLAKAPKWLRASKMGALFTKALTIQPDK